MKQTTPIGRMPMTEPGRKDDWALPCPACGYDLRGQGLQAQSLHLQSVRGQGSSEPSLQEHDTHAQGLRAQSPGKPGPQAHDLRGQSDLRGQNDPPEQSDLRCPECGERFDDFDAMREASAYAARVSTRIIQVRARVAVVLGLGFLVVPVFAGLGYLVGMAIDIDADAAAGFALLAAILVCFGIGGAWATWVFLQLLWCFVKPRVPMAQKRELLGSIPILLVFQIPFYVFALVLYGLIR